MMTLEQKAVVDDLDGGILLVAAAGSGKTSVIKERFINMISKGIDPSRILCITFTNKAGNEMRERVSSATGINPKKLSIFTFHGLCNYWLRTNSHMVGIDRYTIMDEDTVSTVIKNITTHEILNKKAYSNFAASRAGTPEEEIISKFLELENSENKKQKYNLIRSTLNTMSKKGSDISTSIKELNIPVYNDFLHKCITDFIQFKRDHGYLDFDDLQKFGIELFQKHIDLSVFYDKVMVDEIQDSSGTDLTLLKSLNISDIMAVGDRRQAIYGFRGATDNNMDQFKTMFNAKDYSLTMNFRSDKSVIAVANATIRQLGLEPMVPFSSQEGKVGMFDFQNDAETLPFITDIIKRFYK